MATAATAIVRPKASLSERFVRFWNRYLLFIYTGFAIVYLMAPVAVSNSASTLSPAMSTTRPRCISIWRRKISRHASSSAMVAGSSACISRE